MATPTREAPIEKKSMNSPDEIRIFEKDKLKLTTLNRGSEKEFGPGDAAIIPPGHDAWDIGNEPVVGIDFTGLKDYAKEGGPQAH
jgi:hypothetical protein